MDISELASAMSGPIVASQGWWNAEFVHWRVPASVVAPLLPRGVVPDVVDGSSWVGAIAFQLTNARVRGLPSTPAWGSFTGVNVRLYGVDEHGRRGVVFRSM